MRAAALAAASLLVAAWAFSWALRPGASFFMEDADFVSAALTAGERRASALFTVRPGGADGFVYRPLGTAFLGAVAMIAGPVPVVFRLTGVGVVLMLSTTVGAIAWRLGSSRAACWAAALAVLVHPAVANLQFWAVGAYDLLAALMLSLAMLAAVRAGPTGLVGSGICIAAACFAKEPAAPGAIAVIGLSALADGPAAARRTAVAMAAGLAVWFALWAPVVGAGANPGLRVTAGLALLGQIGWLAFFPPGHAGVYHLFDPASATGPAAGVAVLGALLLLARGGRLRPEGAAYAWAAAVAVATTLPAALAVPGLVAQPIRYVLLPFVAVLPFVAKALAARSRLAVPLTAIWLLAAASYSLPRTTAWHTPRSLWEDEARVEPNPYVLTLLAAERLRQARTSVDIRSAGELLDRALDGAPTAPPLLRPCALHSFRALVGFCLEDASAIGLAQRIAEGCSLPIRDGWDGIPCLAAGGFGLRPGEPPCAAIRCPDP